MKNISVIKSVLILNFIFFFIFSFAFQAYAQSSDGTGTLPPTRDPVPPASTGTTAPQPISTPAPLGAPSTSNPRPRTIAPKPVIPAPVVPVATPPASEIIIEPILHEGNSNKTLFLTIVGSAVLGGLLLFGLQTNKKKKGNPCEAIKTKRDVKERELTESRRKFSLQEAVVEKLKEELEKKEDLVKNYSIQQVKNKTLDIIGSNTLSTSVRLAEKAQKIYDGVNQKYESAKDLLAVLKNRKELLESDLGELESKYNQCMMQVTKSASNIVNGATIDLTSVGGRKITTLLFLNKPHEKKILLAMKKRDFGKGKWNGVGGKLKENETIKSALQREAKEEINIMVQEENLRQVAKIDFSFKDNNEWDQETHVFFTEKWEGEPEETEEMSPMWYSTDSLPFESMWVDDIHWLPLVLAGQKVHASFIFDKTGDKIIAKEIKNYEQNN